MMLLLTFLFRKPSLDAWEADTIWDDCLLFWDLLWVDSMLLWLDLGSRPGLVNLMTPCLVIPC